jgi:signal transduction histidine kinase
MGYKDAFVLVKNVLDNVVKHCATRPVTLTIEGQRRHDTVTLTFTDDGPGVAATDLQRIFRPMTTLRRRDEVEGSGMGLAIFQRIAERYGGEIWAGDAPEGRGFRLRVRIQDAPRA